MEKELEQLAENILNWYPFEKNTKVLNISSEFVFEEIENKTEFDYIIIIGSLPFVSKNNNMSSEEFIKSISKKLKTDGKMLIAVNNKFGLKYFVGEPDPYLKKKFVSLLNYNNETEKIETYTKRKLIELLENCGFKGHNFYYPLPDYTCPNVIFTDKELPTYNNVSKYVPNYSEKATVLINEIDLYKEILKEDNNLFPFFANSFLIEVSKNAIDYKYKYISFNNMRKDKYRLITKIGNEYVEKEVVNSKANKHYEQIIDNIKILNKRNLNIIDEINDKKIKGLYLDNKKLVSNILVEKLKENNEDGFYNLINDYIEEIKKSSDTMNEKEKNVFEKYNISISEEQKNKLHFLENAFWDMTFDNCFYIDNKFYFFDQEWKCANMPLEYILYRSIIYTLSLRHFIDINKIIDKYELEEYIDIFKELDDNIQKEIRDDKIWKYYSEDKYFNIDDTKQEVINSSIREKAKDERIENLNKIVKNVENEKVSTFIMRKIKRKIRGKK